MNLNSVVTERPMRDDFPHQVKETLAKRVGCRCSNPGCKKLTSGPHEDPTKVVNIGVAAHITAAAPGGKRYDPTLSPQERKSINNGIWLCQNCGKLIDSDEQKYPVSLLRQWKQDAEQKATAELETKNGRISASTSRARFQDYLQALIDQTPCWWLDEINELTWYEFELFTKVKEPDAKVNDLSNEILRPILAAIENGKNQSILITGEPGTGKSTLLERLAKDAARTAQQDDNAPIPILIKLKDYETSGECSGIRGFTQASLKSHDPSFSDVEIDELLQSKQVLFLIDGWNELSDSKAKEIIKSSFKPYLVIATSRYVDDYWQIQQRFEIQPLSTTEVDKFFSQRLPNAERYQLQILIDRVQDFGQTPLMVWMLYSIFKSTDAMPSTRGETYYQFTKLYEKRAKAGIDLTNTRSALGLLAFQMMQSRNPDDPTDFSLNISEFDAIRIVGSEIQLDKLKNHLLRWKGKGNSKISFCHQSLQEYYAAEQLREQLIEHPEWLEKQPGDEYTYFQRAYLNYLKWTEPIALLLGLLSDPKIVIALVNQALEVDWRVGARLAGEVSLDFQPQLVSIVESLPVPDWLTVELLGVTRSDSAKPLLAKFISHQNIELVEKATSFIGKTTDQTLINSLTLRLEKIDLEFFSQKSFGGEDTLGRVWSLHVKALANLVPAQAIELLRKRLLDPKTQMVAALTTEAVSLITELSDNSVILGLMQYFKSAESKNGKMAIMGLIEEFKNVDAIVPELIEALNLENDEKIQNLIIAALGRSNSSIEALITSLENPKLSDEAVKQLLKNKDQYINQKNIDQLESFLEHENWHVRWSAARVLGGFGIKTAISVLVNVMTNGYPDYLFENHLDKEHIDYIKLRVQSDVRAKAASILGLINDELSINSLRDALHDFDESVRLEAACSLTNFGIDEGISEILASLNIPRFTINSIKSLGKIKNKEPLLEILQFREEKMGWELASVELAKIGYSEISKELFEVLVKPSYVSVSEVIKLLPEFADQTIIERLLEALENPVSYTQDPYFINRVSFVLAECQMQIMQAKLPYLTRMLLKQNIPNLFWVIARIQSRCQYYNYDIYQQRDLEDRSGELRVGSGVGTTQVYIGNINANNSPINLLGTVGGNQSGTQTND